MSDVDRFIAALIASLLRRYNDCPATTTPDTVLLAVLNAVHDARAEMLAARPPQDQVILSGGEHLDPPK